MTTQGPIKELIAEKIRSHREELCQWLLANEKKAPPPFYCSIDLRDSGHKIVPVDCNLYPAGFNNICSADHRAASGVFQEVVKKTAQLAKLDSIRKIILIPEANTKNAFYAENLWHLREILKNADLEVRVGWYDSLTTDGSSEPVTLRSLSGKEVVAEPLSLREGKLFAGDFQADMVLLNNDFSTGVPSALLGLKQPILPTLKLGWHTRKKATHFHHYNQLAEEFAKIIGIDPWILQVDTRQVGEIRFSENEGADRVADEVDALLERTRIEYDQRGIKTAPFAFVKSDVGTYGMGIMRVSSGEEMRTMNRREKNKMSVGKNRIAVESVVVQEGIPTATVVDGLPAEPVIYLGGRELLGGFLRTNTQRGNEENLNSQGMVFKKLCMSDLPPVSEMADPSEFAPQEPLLELVYGNIARISALAAGREMKENPDSYWG